MGPKREEWTVLTERQGKRPRATSKTRNVNDGAEPCETPGPRRRARPSHVEGALGDDVDTG